MGPTRREFMRGLGVTLASLLATRCQPTCYVPVMETVAPSGSLSSNWREARKLWYDLDLLARDAHDYERGEATLARLIDGHSAALAKLQQTGEIDAAIATDLQAAFEGAAYHVWRSNAPMTCYMFMAGPGHEANVDLALQADLLQELASRSEIDEATVQRIRDAIERDVAIMAMPFEEQQTLVQAAIQAGGGNHPSLADLDLDIPPDVVTAAEMLVELLLGRP